MDFFRNNEFMPDPNMGRVYAILATVPKGSLPKKNGCNRNGGYL
jgi:hypothetical protein